MPKLKHVLITLFLLFSCKSLVHPDAASVIGMLLNLSAYYVLEFFSSSSVESKALARLDALESNLSDVKTVAQQITLTLGMRGTRIDSNNKV